ncbi:carbohydrate esterase family 5 protein [Cucurbitaria berberidis CBS 394.84]|uniref:Carbohydrate esterase family 5 protein n=1 Tax=Cucurbitaria berberidis CBS 394.84 TaxID=1168544 RepID=A0A9P4GS91_9PLEO|nr:carbohydrate esterase family 5 protein [Cucurbitaria berberidis CBS 394.84]KAF1850405.1 carbohydrate esterase family 5 protein [Cucurbitaria berberidis CBS 394.84]
MISLLSSLALVATVVLAQQRCDAPSPSVYCNTTEILQYQTSDCRPFHIFLSRGSDEPYPGRLGNLTSEICSALGGEDCGFENIQYPAKSTAWGTEEWCKSAAKGAASGQAQMKAFSEKCPDSKLILLGFSQGAAVAQDILGGGGGHVFACEQVVNPAMEASSAPGSKVVAAITFGAVVRSRDQNFTIGDGKPYDGRRARTPEQLEALNKYSNVLLDYCHHGDPMCAVGSTPESVEAHLNYFVMHNEEVVSQVVKMAKAATSSSDAQSAQTGPGNTGSAGGLNIDSGSAFLAAFITAALLHVTL